MQLRLPTRRWVRISAAALIVLVLAWVVSGVALLMNPRVDSPVKVDAILVLGPPDVDGRSAMAYHLAREGYANTVVLSVTSDLQQRLKTSCQRPNVGFTIICFQPDPATTRGEAEQMRRFATENGWTSVMVVTSVYHISRARLIVDRCLDGPVLMIAAPQRPHWYEWPYQFLYQTAGYAKALWHQSC